MGIKKLKLSGVTSKKAVDPLDIFNNKLTLRGSIKNIWEPQAEALRGWHGNRERNDTVIQMNTGGGKTLVGLLIAQSLLHELNRRIVYVVANNQLVEQTLARASEIGLSPASRYNFEWQRKEEFEAADTFCVTNYTAVFNGFSTFRDRDVNGFVFDDAHVAETTIRDCFTLKIGSDSDAFNAILTLYRPHSANTLGASKLQDIADDNPTTMLFVPMFVVWKHAQELRTLLLDSGIDEAANTKYVWNHLSNHLAHCTVLIRAQGVEISPPVVPLHTLPYFRDSVKRTYLTATLPSHAAFARTFGITNPTVVHPGGKSGDAQRLFIFAAGETDEVQRASALKLVEEHKACVISPSKGKADQWNPPSLIFDKSSGHEGIEDFAESDDPQLLGLVARYDGIDLPGDACRILILDRLPRGESFFDRFMDEGAQTDAIRVGHTATRIVQAIGRIFRSNTDHGAVILVGSDLHDWIRNPSNRSYLPPLLQQQLALALELHKKIKANEVTEEELLNGVLTGDADWDDLYNDNIDAFLPALVGEADAWYPAMLLREREGYSAIWDGDFGNAIDCFSTLAEDAQSKDAKIAAWYKHLEGLAHLCANDQPTALSAFAEAAARRNELIRPSETRDKMFKQPEVDTIGFQARTLASLYRKKRAKVVAWLKSAEERLVYGNNTSEAEKAMETLGVLLGIESSRHDNEGGPDNLWSGEEHVWGFDLKTGKLSTSVYSKDEISQSHTHSQWVSDNCSHPTRRHAIVGHELAVSSRASPAPSLEVIDLAGFQEIVGSVKKMFEAVDAGSKDNLEESFEAWIRHFGLQWPDVVLALPSRKAQDMKSD